MTTAGSWSIATIASLYPELIEDIGVAAMPTFDGNAEVATATNGGWVYVISSSCTNPEAAAKVIQFLVGGEGAKSLEYLQAAYYSKSSPRISVQTQLLGLAQSQTLIPAEWISVVTSVAEKAPMEPIYSWDISVAVAALLENAALGNDISDEIAETHASIQALIASNDLAHNNPRG
jgi:multiple sugar transport system substrate-binding protein